MTDTAWLGIDVGTSGVRAALIDSNDKVLKIASSPMDKHGENRRDPHVWWAATNTALKALNIDIPVTAVCVDATSGTVLPIDSEGKPLSDALMYNDRVPDPAIIRNIADCAPPESAVHGASSALGRAITLQTTPGAVSVIHQADWIAGMLSGNFAISDESNALKTGYDPVQRCWPEWLAASGINVDMLPVVVPAGTTTGSVLSGIAGEFGLSENTLMVAGVTDGCASFLATGATEIGDCVTALGTTITMKMLCDQPLFNPQYGIYSHRIGDRWLAGGASNTGGNVLAHYFSNEEVADLSNQINPDIEAPFQYYPLISSGERFPHNDASWPPVLNPRPQDDSVFLHCLLEGMAMIESLGYQRLSELGAPRMLSMRTVGGGAVNPVWSAIRQRCLSDSLSTGFEPPLSTEAAVGVALLARDSCKSGN